MQMCGNHMQMSNLGYRVVIGYISSSQGFIQLILIEFIILLLLFKKKIK